jgi:ribulose-5-phosphate 4-epimerase/fuculose-1-phosphate aldolase
MLETICDLFSEAYKRNWITARDGNASIRWADRDHFFITPSGVRKQTLQPEMFKKVKFQTNILPVPPFIEDTYTLEKYTDISEKLVPSGELPMHLLLQEKIDTEVRVVLHFHPTYTVAAMHSGIELADLVREFPELGRYTSVAPNVPLLPPITQELADSCVENISLNKETGNVKYNIVGMDRHGVVSVDTSPWRAFEHIERLEHICKIVLSSKEKMK